MARKSEPFRYILLFYFRENKKGSDAEKDLCGLYGNECLREQACQYWFKFFT